MTILAKAQSQIEASRGANAVPALSGAGQSLNQPSSLVELMDLVDLALGRLLVVLKQDKELIKMDRLRQGEYPAAHPAHSILAHQTFSTAAIEQVVFSLNSVVGVLTAEECALLTPTTTSGTSAGVRTDAAVPVDSKAEVLEGAYDIRNTHTAAPAATDVDQLSLDPVTFSPERLLQQTGIELAAKFMYIYALVTKIATTSQHCYKLRQRAERLRKALKPKRAKTLQEQAVEDIQKRKELTAATLEESLSNFDKAREALGWLRRDYELSCAMYQLTEVLIWTKAMRNKRLYVTNVALNVPADLTATTHDELVAIHRPNADEEEIRKLNDLLVMLQSKVPSLELAMEHNERKAMDLAFDYLDTDNDGSINAADCPNLSRALFSALDNNTGVITRKSLNAAVLALSTKISQDYTRFGKLKADSPAMEEKKELVSASQQYFKELQSASQQYFSDRKTLREIHSYFHQYFVQRMFHNLDEAVSRKSVDLENIELALLELEGSSRSIADPMRANTDTGAPMVPATIALPHTVLL
jgi:hypothetical protein